MPRIPLLIVALFFIAGGIAHFIAMDFFISIMPSYLSYHKELVIISGVFELLGAIGILLPKTRLLAGYGLMALIVAVYPANIHMALNPELFPDVPLAFLYLRLPMQFVLFGFVWWAIKPERLASKNN
jgi:uncharacterized membrane protein